MKMNLSSFIYGVVASVIGALVFHVSGAAVSRLARPDAPPRANLEYSVSNFYPIPEPGSTPGDSLLPNRTNKLMAISIVNSGRKAGLGTFTASSNIDFGAKVNAGTKDARGMETGYGYQIIEGQNGARRLQAISTDGSFLTEAGEAPSTRFNLSPTHEIAFPNDPELGVLMVFRGAYEGFNPSVVAPLLTLNARKDEGRGSIPRAPSVDQRLEYQEKDILCQSIGLAILLCSFVIVTLSLQFLSLKRNLRTRMQELAA